MKPSTPKKVLIFSLLLIFSIAIHAQDRTQLQAIALFNKAQAAYDNASYEESLEFIKQTITLLGSTNSKLLYLKIQNLSLLSKIDSKKTLELREAITTFYERTNQKTFPQDKILNVASIEIEMQVQEKMNREKEKQEAADFQKVKTSQGFEELSSFLSNYPDSKYLQQLKEKLAAFEEYKRKLVIEEENQKKEAKKMVGVSGFYLNGGFALEKWMNMSEVKLPAFTATGFSIDFGNKFFKKKNYTKKFQAGLDVTWVNYTITATKYNYTDSVYASSWYTYLETFEGKGLIHNVQFLKIGPSFAWNLKKNQHFLYLAIQVGGNYISSTFQGREVNRYYPPNYRYPYTEFYEYTRQEQGKGIGPMANLKLEYLYRKLVIGIAYQFTYQMSIDGDNWQTLNHQIIVPSIGVKF